MGRLEADERNDATGKKMTTGDLRRYSRLMILERL